MFWKWLLVALRRAPVDRRFRAPLLVLVLSLLVYSEAATLHTQGSMSPIQRMTTDEWLKCIEREKHDPHGHVGPTEVGNLPRPRERGGCDCPSCTNPENLKLLEEWEKKRAA